MGLASELDTLLKKQKEVGLSSRETLELERLWGRYLRLNKFYGKKIRSFRKMQKEVVRLEKDEKLKGS